MSRVFATLVIGVVVLAFGIIAGQTGLIRFAGPSLPDLTDVETQVAVAEEEARIVAIEPVALDCRARVHVEVPVEGVRDHKALGQVYRTDRVTLEAIGDVDTCVEGDSVRVERFDDGGVEVTVDASSIVFVRPRVDAVATADSLEVDQGFVGKVTDVFPWVDDDLGLTPLAYAYAQNVIGSSACMETAYTVTEEILLDAYRRQYEEQGGEPGRFSVRIEGEPEFPDPADIELEDGVRLEVDGGQVSCVVIDGPAAPTSEPAR